MMRVPYDALTSDALLGRSSRRSRSACETAHDFFALRRVQVAGRLVRQNHLRIRDHGARDADQLLLPPDS